MNSDEKRLLDYDIVIKDLKAGKTHSTKGMHVQYGSELTNLFKGNSHSATRAHYLNIKKEVEHINQQILSEKAEPEWGAYVEADFYNSKSESNPKITFFLIYPWKNWRGGAFG